jgi:hypothetical protein
VLYSSQDHLRIGTRDIYHHVLAGAENTDSHVNSCISWNDLNLVTFPLNGHLLHRGWYKIIRMDTIPSKQQVVQSLPTDNEK